MYLYLVSWNLRPNQEPEEVQMQDITLGPFNDSGFMFDIGEQSRDLEGYTIRILENDPTMLGSFFRSYGSSLRCINRKSRSYSATEWHQEITHEVVCTHKNMSKLDCCV